MPYSGKLVLAIAAAGLAANARGEILVFNGTGELDHIEDAAVPVQ